MENLSDSELYVCDPSYVKEGLIGYVSYRLMGTDIQDYLSRRYKDFDALRKKLVERWPGIYIPNIPHKKILGNFGEVVIRLRIEILNRFLKKLCKLNYFYKSEEVYLFLQNSTSVPKTLDNLKPENYESLLTKYKQSFEFDENYDEKTGKLQQEKFEAKIADIYPKIKAFRRLVFAAKERYKDEQDNNLSIINMLSLYEKDTLNPYVNNKEDKLIFFNMKNKEINDKIIRVQDELLNPYDRLYDAITDDYLNIEAMKEACDGLNNLRDIHTKMLKKAGKNPEKDKEMDNLGNIIKIATSHMEKTIKEFKSISLENYHAELARIEEDTNSNIEIFNDLWEIVINDKNVSGSK